MPSELRSRRLAPEDDDEDEAELMASYVTVEDASAVPTDESSVRVKEQKRGLDGDGVNVLVLLFLYILQVSLVWIVVRTVSLDTQLTSLKSLFYANLNIYGCCDALPY